MRIEEDPRAGAGQSVVAGMKPLARRHSVSCSTPRTWKSLNVWPGHAAAKSLFSSSFSGRRALENSRRSIWTYRGTTVTGLFTQTDRENLRQVAHSQDAFRRKRPVGDVLPDRQQPGVFRSEDVRLRMVPHKNRLASLDAAPLESSTEDFN